MMEADIIGCLQSVWIAFYLRGSNRDETSSLSSLKGGADQSQTVFRRDVGQSVDPARWAGLQSESVSFSHRVFKHPVSRINKEAMSLISAAGVVNVLRDDETPGVSTEKFTSSPLAATWPARRLDWM